MVKSDGPESLITLPKNNVRKTYRYVAGKLASKFLYLYNLWERIFDKTFLARRYGSFVIGFGTKK